MNDTSIHHLEKFKISPNFHIEYNPYASLFFIYLPYAELLLFADTNECF